jgi:hypothetical protein
MTSFTSEMPSSRRRPAHAFDAASGGCGLAFLPIDALLVVAHTVAHVERVRRRRAEPFTPSLAATYDYVAAGLAQAAAADADGFCAPRAEPPRTTQAGGGAGGTARSGVRPDGDGRRSRRARACGRRPALAVDVDRRPGTGLRSGHARASAPPCAARAPPRGVAREDACGCPSRCSGRRARPSAPALLFALLDRMDGLFDPDTDKPLNTKMSL